MNRHRNLSRALAAGAFAIFGTLAQAQSSSTPANPNANVNFVSGGVGLAARQEMLAQANQYNLHLEFAVAPEGEYLSDVDVSIADTRGATLLSTRTQGPWLLARLPAGNYTVNARYGEITRQQSVVVGAGRRHVVMRFPQTSEQLAVSPAKPR